MALDKNTWHLDKTVSLSHILTTAVLAASIFTWGANMDKRVSLVEQEQTRQEKDMRRLDVTIDTKLNAIDKKIDRLIERELNRGQR